MIKWVLGSKKITKRNDIYDPGFLLVNQANPF